MSKLIINESPPLKGRVRVSGSKNAALPIMAASLLADEDVTVQDVPALSDVFVMQNIIETLGGHTAWDARRAEMRCRVGGLAACEVPYELAGSLRASFVFMGPLLARAGRARLPLPGGCSIGARPVDLHLKGFAAMGAEIDMGHGYVEARAPRLRGAAIYLDFPSVGATENILMAAALAEGQTTIQNCAVEPEIVDLSNCLCSMGADVRGAGTATIRVNGAGRLHGANHTVIPDRIEAGTFMIAAAATKGDVLVENVVPDHLKPITAKLGETNAVVEQTDAGIRVRWALRNDGRPKAVDLKTMPYPGFPTDMQAQFMAFLAGAEGSSVIVETIFENRFMHVGELKRMGANIKIDSRSAIVEGVPKLTGAQVRATDLRAGAALVIAALAAGGTTEVSDIHHLERGYEKLEDKFRALGGKIVREEE